MSQDNWVDVSKTDGVIVISVAVVIAFLIFVGFALAPTGIPSQVIATSPVTQPPVQAVCKTPTLAIIEIKQAEARNLVLRPV